MYILYVYQYISVNSVFAYMYVMCTSIDDFLKMIPPLADNQVFGSTPTSTPSSRFQVSVVPSIQVSRAPIARMEQMSQESVSLVDESSQLQESGGVSGSDGSLGTELSVPRGETDNQRLPRCFSDPGPNKIEEEDEEEEEHFMS